jgi:hypothetical protein
MSNEPTATKSDPLKPVKRLFGLFCPFCKKFAPIGAENIEPSVGVSKLRDKLHLENFQHPPVTCDDPKCGHTFDVTVDQIFLGEPDGTLPIEETF